MSCSPVEAAVSRGILKFPYSFCTYSGSHECHQVLGLCSVWHAPRPSLRASRWMLKSCIDWHTLDLALTLTSGNCSLSGEFQMFPYQACSQHRLCIAGGCFSPTMKAYSRSSLDWTCAACTPSWLLCLSASPAEWPRLPWLQIQSTHMLMRAF